MVLMPAFELYVLMKNLFICLQIYLLLSFLAKICSADSEPTKLLDHSKQKPKRGGVLRQINTCRKVPLQFF
jgi:hypothetical protein